MPLILFVIVVILIAQIGFWDTLGAVLGAAAMVVLLVVLLALAAAVAVYLAYRRARRPRI